MVLQSSRLSVPIQYDKEPRRIYLSPVVTCLPGDSRLSQSNGCGNSKAIMSMDTPPEASAFTIPTINISPYLHDPNSEASAKVIQDVRRACMTTGFFSLVGHGVPRQLQERVFAACEKLFSLPLEEKQALISPVLKNRGYELIGSQVQKGSLPDLKEGFYIGHNVPSDDPRSQKHPYFVGENIFPPSIPDPDIKEPTEAYYQVVFDVAVKVLEILARGLPYGNSIFDAFVSDNPICILRLLHYPPQMTQDERQLGAGAHTDFGAITLLLQDSCGGLEVLNDATGEFVPVEPNPDAYVVNIGDMLAMWTKNIYKSNMHRVINRSQRDRYSIPFFFDGNCDVVLRPLDGSEPLRGGKAPTVVEHMLERFSTTYGGTKTAVVAGATTVDVAS